MGDKIAAVARMVFTLFLVIILMTLFSSVLKLRTSKVEDVLSSKEVLSQDVVTEADLSPVIHLKGYEVQAMLDRTLLIDKNQSDLLETPVYSGYIFKLNTTELNSTNSKNLIAINSRYNITVKLPSKEIIIKEE